MSVFDFFITSAYAAEAAPQAGGGYSLFIMCGIFIAFMYFAILRPQNKRAKEQRDLLNSLAKGDEVVTVGGMLGKITKLSDNYVVLSLSDNVEVTLQRSSIAGALPKGTLKSI